MRPPNQKRQLLTAKTANKKPNQNPMKALLGTKLDIKDQAKRTETEMINLMQMFDQETRIITAYYCGPYSAVTKYKFSCNGQTTFSDSLHEAVLAAFPDDEKRKSESIKLAEILEAKAAKLREGAR